LIVTTCDMLLLHERCDTMSGPGPPDVELRAAPARRVTAPG